MDTTNQARLGDLENGSWFELDGYDYRVITRWSTGVEIKGATSAGDRRVLSPDTVVTLT